MHYKHFKIGKYHTSSIELRDLSKALFGIALAFAIAFSGGQIFNTSFVIAFFISLIVVGIGFIFHELAHKVMAQKYGCQAEFRSFDMMLVVAVLIAFSGFIFIAPGAVMIGGRQVSKKENGIISVVGPLMNIILALIFFGFGLLTEGILSVVANYGFILNSLLAVFNMLPIGNFDGRKVLAWNKLIWVLMIVVSGGMFMVSYAGIL